MHDKLTPQMIEDIKAIAPVLIDLETLIKSEKTKGVRVDIALLEDTGYRFYSHHEITRAEKAKPFQRYYRMKSGGGEWIPISEEEYNELDFLPESVLNHYEFKIEYAGFSE